MKPLQLVGNQVVTRENGSVAAAFAHRAACAPHLHCTCRRAAIVSGSIPTWALVLLQELVGTFLLASV